MKRYDAQRTVWAITKVTRFAGCGRFLRDRSKPVGIRGRGVPGTPGARAGFTNLQSCGSVWSCPVCAEKINAERQSDIERALEAWKAQGGHLVFGTFTMKHDRGMPLAETWDAITPAWQKVVAGKGWHGDARRGDVGDKEEFSIVGWTRVIEVTYGVNGWHPHIHAIFFTRRMLTDQELVTLRTRMFNRWSAGLGARGYKTLAKSKKDGKFVGVDLRRIETSEYLAEYFTKMGYPRENAKSTGSAAYDVTGSQTKAARKDGRTPMQILSDLTTVKLTEAGPVDKASGELLEHAAPQVFADLHRWWEWEESSAGRRQLTWSRGLRDLLGLGLEQSDEDLASADETTDAPISDIDVDLWRDEWLHFVGKREQLLGWWEDGSLTRRMARWRDARQESAFLGRWRRRDTPPAPPPVPAEPSLFDGLLDE